MGRPSKLTDAQWAEVHQRIIKGEKPADLAREYGVSKTRISARFSGRFETVQAVANQILSAETALKALPVSEQVQAISILDDLRALSHHLTGAAKFGAATAHRLNGIAHAKVQEIDDAAPLGAESMETLKSVAVLTKIANDSATIGLNLLAANKEAVKDMNQQAKPQPARILVEVVDASVPDDAAA